MTLGLRERRAHERAKDVADERRTDDARAETEHVHVVVFHALTRRERVVAERRPDARELVGRHGRADSAPAEEHPPLGAAILDRLRNALGIVGIVIARYDLVRTAVQDVVPQGSNDVQRHLLERKAGVIGSYRDAHDAPDRNSVTPGTSAQYTRATLDEQTRVAEMTGASYNREGRRGSVTPTGKKRECRMPWSRRPHRLASLQLQSDVSD